MNKVCAAAAVAAVVAGAAAGCCYAYADREILRQHIRSLLKRSLSVLRLTGAQHFIAFGTLLGYARDGDVIEKDTDGDVGLFAADAPKVLAAKSLFRNAGVNLEVHGDYLIRLKDASAPYVYIDLYLLDHDTTSNTLGRALWGGRDKSVVFPAAMVLPLRDVIFLGVQTTVPSEPGRLLEHIYGKSWRTPRQHDKGVHSQMLPARLFGLFDTFRLGFNQIVHGK
jgi:hypothetical protein